ncbi:MAG: ATP-binding protein [Alphaproteobacteria bacterium]
MFQRYIYRQVKEALADTPVVFIMGARQSGKTTLVQGLIDDSWEYVTFDDQTQLEAAKFDPVSFIAKFAGKRVVLDEVQRVPEIFLAIKKTVDEDRRPGRFLLTGSANALLLPQIADSLAGRIEAIQLYPLSMCEVSGQGNRTFLSKLMAGTIPKNAEEIPRAQLINMLIAGGFPEPAQRKQETRQAKWYQQYIQTLIQRDIKDISSISNVAEAEKVIRLAAFFSGKLVNFSELGAKIGLNYKAIQKYLQLLEQLFLLETLPAWHSNEYKRLVKAPKMHLADTGIISSIRGLTKDMLIKNPHEMGSLLETFVYNELRKQASWLHFQPAFTHYRDKDKVEVDIIIEDSNGQCFAFEVKASATLSSSDLKGIQKFSEVAGKRFQQGVLVYTGDKIVPFGPNILAVPVSALWS